MPLLGVLGLVTIDLREIIVAFAIGNKYRSHGRLSLVWLPECDKFDVLQPVFEQFGSFLRSRWKFEIEIEARCACKQLRIAVLSLASAATRATVRASRIISACVARSRWGKGWRGGGFLLVYGSGLPLLRR